MSSAATILLEDTEVTLDDWCAFCVEHQVIHHPQTVGGNVFYLGGLGGVEVTYEPKKLRFSTFFMGEATPCVARIAVSAWLRWGGLLRADPEIRELIAKETK